MQFCIPLTREHTEFLLLFINLLGGFPMVNKNKYLGTKEVIVVV
jgi:hypothetical protein